MTPTPSCPHKELILDVSPFANEAGFARAPWEKRLAASRPSGRIPSKEQLANEPPEDRTALTFPGPLVLPDDDLALDPKSPPQTLRSFVQEGARNKVTEPRQTIYVAAPPEIDHKVPFLADWAHPCGKGGMFDETSGLMPPRTNDIMAYLSAFYHGLPVVRLPDPLRFVSWEEEKPSRQGKPAAPKIPSFIGLQAGSSVTRITTRRCPDNLFSHQLSLSDILDAAIDILPADAYSIILLTHHDLYEDDDDDFCCGRAFGGSRVCVVSTARYHPPLDASIGIDPAHMWPASHCKAYIDSLLLPRLCSQKHKADKATHGAMSAAVIAAATVPTPKTGTEPSGLRDLWLSRVCRTASHELGHCIGLDHCVHYACVMQGTASLVEDSRQPPYLCPVCLAKLARSISFEFKGARDEGPYVVERNVALLGVLERWCHVSMFAGFEAWIRAQMPVELAIDGSL